MTRFIMTAECQPKNSDKWFDGFNDGDVFFATDMDAARDILNDLCAEHETNNDPHWDEFGPYPIKWDEED